MIFDCIEFLILIVSNSIQREEKNNRINGKKERNRIFLEQNTEKEAQEHKKSALS